MKQSSRYLYLFIIIHVDLIACQFTEDWLERTQPKSMKKIASNEEIFKESPLVDTGNEKYNDGSSKSVLSHKNSSLNIRKKNIVVTNSVKEETTMALESEKNMDDENTTEENAEEIELVTSKEMSEAERESLRTGNKIQDRIPDEENVDQTSKRFESMNSLEDDVQRFTIETEANQQMSEKKAEYQRTTIPIPRTTLPTVFEIHTTEPSVNFDTNNNTFNTETEVANEEKTIETSTVTTENENIVMQKISDLEGSGEVDLTTEENSQKPEDSNLDSLTEENSQKPESYNLDSLTTEANSQKPEIYNLDSLTTEGNSQKPEDYNLDSLTAGDSQKPKYNNLDSQTTEGNSQKPKDDNLDSLTTEGSGQNEDYDAYETSTLSTNGLSDEVESFYTNERMKNSSPNESREHYTKNVDTTTQGNKIVARKFSEESGYIYSEVFDTTTVENIDSTDEMTHQNVSTDPAKYGGTETVDTIYEDNGRTTTEKTFDTANDGYIGITEKILTTNFPGESEDEIIDTGDNTPTDSTTDIFEENPSTLIKLEGISTSTSKSSLGTQGRKYITSSDPEVDSKDATQTSDILPVLNNETENSLYNKGHDEPLVTTTYPETTNLTQTTKKSNTTIIERDEDSNYIPGIRLFVSYPNLRKIPPEKDSPNEFTTPNTTKSTRMTREPSTWMFFSTTSTTVTTTKEPLLPYSTTITNTKEPLLPYSLNKVIVPSRKLPVDTHSYQHHQLEPSPQDAAIQDLIKFIIQRSKDNFKDKLGQDKDTNANMFENELFKLSGNENYDPSLEEKIKLNSG